MEPESDRLYAELEAALDSAENETARYHLRQALQLRIAEKETEETRLSV